MLTLFSFLLALAIPGYGASLDPGIRCTQDAADDSTLTTASPPSSQETDSVLVRARDLFEEAQSAREANDQSAARAKASEAIEMLLEAGEGVVSKARLSLLEDLGSLAYQTGELGPAKLAWSRVLEVLSETLPGDHPDLQKVRGDLAVTIQLLGDFQGARAMQEQVLDVCSRTLPDDHPDLQRARANLAITIQALGDLQGVRALQEKVLTCVAGAGARGLFKNAAR